MTQRSRFWDGTSIGDAVEAPYNAPTEFAAVLRSLCGAAAYSSLSGVCRDELSELDCISTFGSPPINVYSGRAFVHGTWYENDNAITFNLDPTPSSRIDILVLRKTWATQEVRLAIVKGVDNAVPVAPALTQTEGVVWEQPLWQLTSLASGGIYLSLTDLREFVPYTAAVVPHTFEKLSDRLIDFPDDIVTLYIPTTPVYAHYVVMFNAKAEPGIHAGVPVFMYFNAGDLTGHYSSWISAFGGVTSGQDLNTWGIYVGNIPQNADGLNMNNCVCFLNGLRTDSYKRVLSIGDTLDVASPYVSICSGGYTNAAMIVTSISLTIDDPGAMFSHGSWFSLYGVL